MKTLPTILLIDDDEDDIYLHIRELKRFNSSFHIITRDNARDALTFLKSESKANDHHPDLIFLDINMPAMNGWEFLEEYTKMDRDLRNLAIVIVLTTSTDNKDRQKALMWDRVVDYIVKPLTAQQIRFILDKYYYSDSIQ